MSTGQLSSRDEHTLSSARRNLPARGWARFLPLIGRAIRLHCPQCGSGAIFQHPWAMKQHCPSCAYWFEREDGYFLGAYALNLVVAEVIGLGAVLVILFRSDFSLLWQEVIAIAAAITLPVLFYPWSRTLWMTFDLQLFHDTDHPAGVDKGPGIPALDVKQSGEEQ